MIIVKKARADDFEKVYPLLEMFNNSRLSKDDWRNLFNYYWKIDEDYFGYMLVDDSEVVGFLGLIFSERKIRGVNNKFCNITSGVVKKAYRNQSFSLFFQLLQLNNYTITDLTPSKEVYALLKKIGFQDNEDKINVILPFPRIITSSWDCVVIFDSAAIKNELNEEDLKIFNDHAGLKSYHILLKCAEGSCYIVANRSKRKFLYFTQVHYVNNKAVFTKFINKFSLHICLRLKTWGIIAASRYIKGGNVKHVLVLRRPQPTLFKSKTIGKDSIDSLYSELLLLNL